MSERTYTDDEVDAMIARALAKQQEDLAHSSRQLTPFLRDDTEHGKDYYLASDVDALLERLAGGGKVSQPSKREDLEELVQRLKYLHDHQLATKSIYSEAADAIKAQAQPDQNSLTKVEPCKVCGEGNARLVVLRSCDTCLSEYAGQPEMSLTLVGGTYTCAKCEIQDPLMDEQKDAARYQHLKSISYAGPIEVGGSHFWNIESHSIRGPSFDEAVDLAIKVLSPPETPPVRTLTHPFVLLSKEDKDVCIDCTNSIGGVCRHSHGPLVPHNGKCGGKWSRRDGGNPPTA